MTAMGREFELKYRADSGNIAAIRAAFGDFSEIRMETVYYDTLDAALSRRRWMLRRRYENGISVCTLKTPLPDGSRGNGRPHATISGWQQKSYVNSARRKTC